MSAVPAATTPIAIFGDLDGGVWGVVLGGDDAAAGRCLH